MTTALEAIEILADWATYAVIKSPRGQTVPDIEFLKNVIKENLK